MTAMKGYSYKEISCRWPARKLEVGANGVVSERPWKAQLHLEINRDE